MAKLLTLHVLTGVDGHRFVRDRLSPVRDLFYRLKPYKPTDFFREILSHTRFDKLYVDAAAKQILDTIDSSSGISEVSFLETLDDYFEVGKDSRVKLLQRLTPPKTLSGTERYELIVVANPDNIGLIESCYASRM